MKTLNQFTKQKYLNLETYRKNGECMDTPVWFVQEGESFYVITKANSGKVKRIRNNGRVNIAACKMDGKLVGKWVAAQAHQVADPELSQKVDRLLDQKYGLLKKMFMSRRSNEERQSTILEIKVL